MRLHTLTLEQFRSYGSLELSFAEGDMHLLIGLNGAGKTNILEAIALLSLTKSCQGADETDLMQWEKEHYRIAASAETDGGEKCTYEVVSQLAPRKQKACYRNDVKISAGEMVGQFPVVVFLPKDLDLFTGTPQQRRSYLDQLLCQISPDYLRTLVEYQKILKQRNKLLKWIAEGRSQGAELSVWDTQLADLGARTTLKRLELLEVLQCTLGEELRALGEHTWEDVELVYERKGEERERAALTQELTDLLAHYRERDTMLQSTSVGPHREDWHLDIAGRSIETFASRGQQRTAVLALLFLQVSYLELRRNERAVILLDDVFSELDDAHQHALLTSFQEHQVILTSTHIPTQVGEARVWDVEDGKVVPR